MCRPIISPHWLQAAPTGGGLGLAATWGPRAARAACTRRAALAAAYSGLYHRAEDEVAVALTADALGQGDSLAESPDPIPASLPTPKYPPNLYSRATQPNRPARHHRGHSDRTGPASTAVTGDRRATYCADPLSVPVTRRDPLITLRCTWSGGPGESSEAARCRPPETSSRW